MQLLNEKNLKKIKSKFQKQIKLKLMYKKENLVLKEELKKKEIENTNLRLDLIKAKRVIIIQKKKIYSK